MALQVKLLQQGVGEWVSLGSHPVSSKLNSPLSPFKPGAKAFDLNSGFDETSGSDSGMWIGHRNLFPSHTDLMGSSRLTVFLVKAYSFSSLKIRWLELTEAGPGGFLARMFQILGVGDALGHSNHQHTWTGFPGDGSEAGASPEENGRAYAQPTQHGGSVPVE